MTQAISSIAVAPNLLVDLMNMALREVVGITQLGQVPGPVAEGTTTGAGSVLRTSHDGVVAECYVIAAAGSQLLQVGVTAQAAVAAVIQDLAGMVVREVNVYILDVEASNG